MNKFDQLVELVKSLTLIYDVRTGHNDVISEFPKFNNVWSTFKSVVDNCEDDVSKMAYDYIHYRLGTGPKPEWVGHFGE